MFFYTLKMDLKRMFQSWKFYIALLGISILTFMNVWPEVIASEYNCSIYYLVNARGGISAFLLATTVLVVFPFGLSYREDVKNNYINNIRSRINVKVYGWSHGLTTALGAFLVVFLGYTLCFIILSFKIQIISTEEIELIQRYYFEQGLTVYEKVLYTGQEFFYFILVFAIEALGYSFMAMLALMLSVKIENSFVLLSTPILFYYGSNFVLSLADLPAIFHWQNIMFSGGCFREISSLWVSMLCVLLYFGGLICLECFLFSSWMERRRING